MRAFNILIVDDDKIVRMTLDSLLRKLGFSTIDQAANGFEALKLLIARQYDLIFLDNLMPVMSGLEFLRRCKYGGILDGTTVVMLTGTAGTDTISAIRDEALRIDDFIIKPLDRAVISAKIDRLLHNAKTAPARRLLQIDSLPPGTSKGDFLSITTETTDETATIRMFGFFLNDDRQFIKDLPDSIASRPEKAIVLDLTNLLMIDEFGLGMLLLVNGVATMCGKRLAMTLDEKTIKNQLVALGLTRIIPLIEAAPAVPDAAAAPLPGRDDERAALLG